MSEVQRYLLCRALPRLSCGFYFQIARDLLAASLADAEALLSISEDVRKEYTEVRDNYDALAPHIRRVTDRLLPWILHLRVQYDDLCADTILAVYVRGSTCAKKYGILSQPN